MTTLAGLREVIAVPAVREAIEQGDETALCFVLQAVDHILEDESEISRRTIDRLWNVLDDPELNRMLGLMHPWSLSGSSMNARRRFGCLAMLLYIARLHPSADKFVRSHFDDSFGQLPFVDGDPLANQFDGSFLIGFICNEIPYDSRFSLGIEGRNPHIPACCHLRTA